MFSPMPPRPLHRWKSFWLGVLVLVFLGWSWIASMRHVDVLYLNSGVGSTMFLHRHFGTFVLTAGHTLGWVEVKWDTSRISPLASHWSHQIITLTPKETWFARAVEVKRSSGRFEIYLAHWMLILLFVLPWAAFLAWRVRRMKWLKASIEH
jgi:hypothetical protein